MEKKLTIDNLFSLKGKTALITGATGMLGKVYVSALLNAGARVIAVDKYHKPNFPDSLMVDYFHDENDFERLHQYKLDITDQSDVKDFFDNIITQNNWYEDTIDVLINNASLVKQVGNVDLSKAYSTFENQKSDDWDQYFQVDVIGALLMVQGVIPGMKKKGNGVIINISSTYGNVAPDQSLYDSLLNSSDSGKIEKPIGYSISKSGVLNMTRHLATLYAKDGIRVNTLTPGGVYSDNPESFVLEYSNRTPMNRMANRKEYAGPILFLSSSASSYMTGANLIVDGGWTAW